MLRLEGVRTRRLSAFGLSDGDIHQARVNASLTRSLSTVTHCAGDGSLAGLKQTNSWQRCKFADSKKASSALIGSVDITGLPATHALPSSTTIDPLGARYSRNMGANEASQLMYCSPCKLPYRFFRLRGNGGDVNISWTLPLSCTSADDLARTSSLRPPYIRP